MDLSASTRMHTFPPFPVVPGETRDRVGSGHWQPVLNSTADPVSRNPCPSLFYFLYHINTCFVLRLILKNLSWASQEPKGCLICERSQAILGQGQALTQNWFGDRRIEENNSPPPYTIINPTGDYCYMLSLSVFLANEQP